MEGRKEQRECGRCSVDLLLALVYSLNQRTEHLGQDFQLLLKKVRASFFLHQLFPFAKLPQGEPQKTRHELPYPRKHRGRGATA